MTYHWYTAGIICIIIGMSGIRKSSRSIFPSRFIPATIIGLAPLFWSLGWDLSHTAGSYPVSIEVGRLWILIFATAWIAIKLPEGNDHAAPQPHHPRAWRWFAAASLVLFAYGTAPMLIHITKNTAHDWLSLLVNTAALVGIYSYAFRRPLLSTVFWRVIALAYCLWTLFSFATHWQGMMAGFHMANGIVPFIIALAIGVPIIIAIPALSCLALFRLSWFPPSTSC